MKIILIGSEKDKDRFIRQVNAKHAHLQKFGEIPVHSFQALIDDETIVLCTSNASLDDINKFDSKLLKEMDLVIDIVGSKNEATISDVIIADDKLEIFLTEDKEYDNDAKKFLSKLIKEFKEKKANDCKEAYEMQSVIESGYSLFKTKSHDHKLCEEARARLHHPILRSTATF